MMKRHLLLLGALALSAFACSSDPNKAANDAHDAELKTNRKALQREADHREDRAEDQAEHDRKNTQAQSGGAYQTGASKDRVEADAKLIEARQVARAKSMERFEKADARAQELRGVIDRAGGKATTQSRDALKAVEDQKVAAKTSIDQITTVPGDDFKRAKDYADTQLDTLEGYLKRAAKEVDNFK